MWMGVLSKWFEENVDTNNFLRLEFKEITSRGIDSKIRETQIRKHGSSRKVFC